MNLKKLVASFLLFTQATNAFAIGQASTQVYADKIKSNAGGTINTNASGTITVPNATDTLVGKATTDVLTNKTLTSPAISGATMSGVTGFPGTSSVDGSGNAIFGGTGNIAGATLIGAAGSADSKSVFELQSTTKGFLPPRMTTAQKNAIVAPTTGLVVYDTDLKSIQVYNGTSWVTAGSGGLSYSADTGAANAYVITPTPAALAYTTGDTYIFKAVNANTTSSTLNVSALGVKNIKTPQVGNIPANAILAGAIVMVVYDGTQFQIISQQDPSRVSPLTTKGDTHTFSTVDARVAVPGDYGRMVPDSNATTGWRPASYTQFQNGAPTKNYVQYADFENNATTGWTAVGCATITAGLPQCNGSAGADFSSSNGGRTKGANTSNPAIDSGSNVAGTYSMNLATTGAGTIGDGYISSAYTIDPADRGKDLPYLLSYKVASGTPAQTGAATDTYAVAVYSPADNAWLSVNNPFSITKASGAGTSGGTVHTFSTTTKIQYFVYSPVAPTGASSLLYDDVNIGSQLLATGPPLTDPVAYTPTFTGLGTPSAVNFTSYREGAYLVVNGTFTAGTTTATEMRISLGYNGADSNVTTLSTLPTLSLVGTGSGGGASSATNFGVIGVLAEASKTYLTFTLQSSSGTQPVKENGSSVVTSATVVSYWAKVPITGWSSNAITSSSTNTGPTVSRVTTSTHTGGFSANTTGTFTPSGTTRWMEICGVGGGGGGGGSGTTSGTAATDGTATTFGTSLISFPGGVKGARNADGGAGGGAPTINAPAVQGLTSLGSQGGGAPNQGTSPTSALAGGTGGLSGLGAGGAAGVGGGGGTLAGLNAPADTGGGGGGAGAGTTTNVAAGSGGGGGTYGCAVITNPVASYTYTVGAKGTGQALGTSGAAGGTGSDGQLRITEYSTFNPNVSQDNVGQVNGSEGAGTTTLTNASIRNQITTLTAARTYVLPTSGVIAGDRWSITNQGDFALTVQASAGATVEVLNVGTLTLRAAISSPTVKADWIVEGFLSRTTVASTWTFNGSGGTSGSVNMVLQRNKEMVNIFIPGPVATSGTSSTQFIANTNLPAAFIPAAQVVFPYNSARNNGGAVGAAGAVFLNASGTLTLVRDTGSTAFTNATSCGFQDNFVGTYYIAL